MSTMTERARDLEVVLSEANGYRSRDTITIAAGAGDLDAGTVLGQVSSSKEYVPADPDAVDGSEVAAAVLLYRTDASVNSAKAVALVRDAEVKKPVLIFGAGFTTDELKTTAQLQLINIGIIPR
ncbi:head decoration protein [Ahrensia marina]|uniref:Head decoration protein n=1 Tax=Ahrensia marina TaxID=1514904 RepID=A0A0M9GN54_9HYPH|nr:head decoration protein [Ahrensia marina]KPB01366.1 hypothetical protein SU32_08950 [Ahrensia marina]